MTAERLAEIRTRYEAYLGARAPGQHRAPGRDSQAVDDFLRHAETDIGELLEALRWRVAGEELPPRGEDVLRHCTSATYIDRESNELRWGDFWEVQPDDRWRPLTEIDR